LAVRSIHANRPGAICGPLFAVVIGADNSSSPS
jgi:hypothetical protein